MFILSVEFGVSTKSLVEEVLWFKLDFDLIPMFNIARDMIFTVNFGLPEFAFS